jgi:hypothetical protein
MAKGITATFMAGDEPQPWAVKSEAITQHFPVKGDASPPR